MVGVSYHDFKTHIKSLSNKEKVSKAVMITVVSGMKQLQQWSSLDEIENSIIVEHKTLLESQFTVRRQ